MTPKSYITLCIIAIIYVIMAAVAVVSPHGSSYAFPTTSDNTISSADIIKTPDPATIPTLLFRNEAGTEVELKANSLNTFSTVMITVDIDGKECVFTAAHFKSLMDWSCLKTSSDMIVFKGDKNSIFACRTIDLQKADNAFLIYADENGEPLDKDTFGDFCLYVKEGSKNGFFTNINIVDFG